LGFGSGFLVKHKVDNVQPNNQLPMFGSINVVPQIPLGQLLCADETVPALKRSFECFANCVTQASSTRFDRIGEPSAIVGGETRTRKAWNLMVHGGADHTQIERLARDQWLEINGSRSMAREIPLTIP
jgi:hypothetical protein